MTDTSDSDRLVDGDLPEDMKERIREEAKRYQVSVPIDEMTEKLCEISCIERASSQAEDTTQNLPYIISLYPFEDVSESELVEIAKRVSKLADEVYDRDVLVSIEFKVGMDDEGYPDIHHDEPYIKLQYRVSTTGPLSPRSPPGYKIVTGGLPEN